MLPKDKTIDNLKEYYAEGTKDYKQGLAKLQQKELRRKAELKHGKTSRQMLSEYSKVQTLINNNKLD